MSMYELRQMSFLPYLQRYLNQNGQIHTVRKYQMPEGVVEVPGVGRCRRARIGQIYSKESLEPYWESSGFASLDNWWVKIKQFIPENGPYWLYKVEKVIDEHPR